MQTCYNKSIIIALMLLVSGCTTLKTEPLAELELELPNSWEAANNNQKMSYGWLRDFNNPKLDSYVRLALENNYNLKASAARLDTAIANAKASRASLFPDLNLNLQRDRRKRYQVNADGVASPEYASDYQANLNLSWEADLWGKLNDRTRSAQLNAQTQKANYLSTRLALTANVAKAWFNVFEADNQYRLNKRQYASLQTSLGIVENSYQGGLRSAADVYSGRSDLENQQAALVAAKQTLEQTKRDFNLLLGRYPSALLILDNTATEIKLMPVPAGLPAQLLNRRPDIVAAKTNWYAQQYTQAATTKDRYPSLTLTGNLGVSSDDLSTLLRSDQVFWSLLGGLTAPIINAGRLKALQESASAQTRLALADYANTLLNAFQEVENALASENYLTQRYQAITASANLAEAAYQLALDQYQNGLVEYVTVLINQRQFFERDTSRITLYNALLQNRIDLYLALGGNFFTTDKSNNAVTSK